MHMFVPRGGPDPCQTVLELGEGVDPVILTMQQLFTNHCQVRYPIMACKCGSRIRRSGCMRHDCPDCAEFVRQRRGNHMFDRFKLVRGSRPVLRTTFTVPMHLRRSYLQRHEWRAAVKKMVKILKADFGFEFGVEVSHPVGETEPGAPEVFHPHINFLWIQTLGHSPHLSLVQLRKLRRSWAEIVGCCGVVNIEHKYYRSDRRIRHACRYFGRNFPGFSIWQGPVRWYGKIPKLPPSSGLCPCCHACYQFLGYALGSEYLEEQLVRINTS